MQAGLSTQPIGRSGTLNRRWVLHDLRDVVVDFLRSLHQRFRVALSRLIDWLGIGRPKY